MARTYRMTARAAGAARTAEQLIGAMQALFVELPFHEITLERVAERAGVTLQTLLRRFGSKNGLVAAASAEGLARVEAQRREAAPGDARGAAKNLLDHYESWGSVSLRLLAQEDGFPEIAAVARSGRATHVAWVERVFADDLKRRRGRARAILRAQLIAVCDVYVWKILRRDLGMSRADAERALLGMIEGVRQQAAGDR
jgi:AcrR family transcriptional regulator